MAKKKKAKGHSWRVWVYSAQGGDKPFWGPTTMHSMTKAEATAHRDALRRSHPDTQYVLAEGHDGSTSLVALNIENDAPGRG